jgi:hypothetical protein
MTLEATNLEEDIEPQTQTQDEYPRIRGGGVSNYLLSLCKKEEVAAIALILFAMEGGDVPMKTTE